MNFQIKFSKKNIFSKKMKPGWFRSGDEKSALLALSGFFPTNCEFLLLVELVEWALSKMFLTGSLCRLWVTPTEIRLCAFDVILLEGSGRLLWDSSRVELFEKIENIEDGIEFDTLNLAIII